MENQEGLNTRKDMFYPPQKSLRNRFFDYLIHNMIRAGFLG